MALHKWNQEHPPDLRAGYALFSTRLVPLLPRTYHAMLFVEHVVNPHLGTQVRICDMAPPMHFGGPREVHRLTQQSYAGSFEDLSREEHRQALGAALQIRWRAPSAQDFNESCEYCLSTHGVEIDDPNDDGASILRVRCSCSSLVEWCYGRIGVDLVRADTLPMYSEEELHAKFYPESDDDSLKNQLQSYGLTGAGPWPVLLPAYQMKAFQKQTTTQLPYDGVATDHPWVD